MEQEQQDQESQELQELQLVKVESQESEVVQVSGADCSGIPCGDIVEPRRAFTRRGPKVEVQAYSVQCASCFKWRLVPSKQVYEAIRECLSISPWVCKNAGLWRSNASCEQPSDIEQDHDKALWALDKPNLPSTPDGWKRDLVIRSRGSTKFADIYYVSPCGKRLRSMVEIRQFLEDNPQYDELSLTQFSFATPKPVLDGYVRPKNRIRGDPGSENHHYRGYYLQTGASAYEIPPPPAGWIRELRIRCRESVRFCDVYYISPCGKKLRSRLEVNSFLRQDPSYSQKGVTLDLFSFTPPKTEQELRKTVRMPGHNLSFVEANVEQIAYE